MMVEGDPRTAFAYASREVRDFWQTHERWTFAEFATQQGIHDAALEEKAARARDRRREASNRAEERRKR